MRYENFKQLEKDYSELCIRENYVEALNLLKDGTEALSKEELEENFFTIMLDKASLYKRCELDEECIDTFAYLIDNGFLCPLHRKLYESLKHNSKYVKLKEKNDLIRAQVEEKTKFQYKVYLPEGYTKDKRYPVFFNLHGDCENMEFHKEYWSPKEFLKRGFIVVYVQSSQVIMHQGYAWLKYALDLKGDEKWVDSPSVYRLSESSCYIKESYDRAHADMKNCYDLISKEYSVDEKCIVVGGFSGGASIAVEIAMAGVIPIKGFVALCPEDKPKIFSREKVEEFVKNGVKGIFMEGEQSLPVLDEEDMMKVFNEAGFSYEYYINKGLGHWYPEELDEKLEQALNFILG